MTKRGKSEQQLDSRLRCCRCHRVSKEHLKMTGMDLNNKQDSRHSLTYFFDSKYSGKIPKFPSYRHVVELLSHKAVRAMPKWQAR